MLLPRYHKLMHFIAEDRTNGASPRRVGYFGGSFDPPHLGHLAVARAAQEALQLDQVLFAPVGAQPLKPQGSSASFADRVAMTRLAIASEPAFAVTLADAPKSDGQPNYTWHTLSELSKGISGAETSFEVRPRLKTDLFLLMGADSLSGFHQWFRAEEIPFLASLVVASRPGESLEDLAALLPKAIQIAPAAESVVSSVEMRVYDLTNPIGQRARLYLLPGLHVEISATEIRAEIERGSLKSNSTLSLPVSDYIRSRFLYQ
jgi:nicotinate-nucleotide adenylyltransferase